MIKGGECEPDAGPNDEERGQSQVPSHASLAHASPSVSFSLGGFKRMSYVVTDLVREQVQKSFVAEEAALVISELEAAHLPFINDGQAPERVHLAILHLSGGDLRRFDRAMRESKTDWRDTLCGAGLGNADWPEVLRSRGIDYKSEPVAQPVTAVNERRSPAVLPDAGSRA